MTRRKVEDVLCELSIFAALMFLLLGAAALVIDLLGIRIRP